MGLPLIVDHARKFAVMVQVQGPDPVGVKTRNSGKTTLRASGMLLPDNLYDAQVAKALSDRNNVAFTLGPPKLVSDARIDIMDEGRVRTEKVDWVEAQLVKLINVPASANALQSLIGASSSSGKRKWEAEWSLGSNGNKSQSSMTTIAILGLSLHWKELPKISTAVSHRRGDLLLAVGSPFGDLSPPHFINSISVGSIANLFPPNKSSGLLMADIHYHPGMEGGPVFGEHGHLIGILSTPLKHNSTGAQIQLVIPWEAIASDLLQAPRNAGKKIYHDRGNSNHNPINVEKAMASVCLISIDNGVCGSDSDVVCGSGVLLNKQGLILTNAHLLEMELEHKSRDLALQKSGDLSSSVADEVSVPNKGQRNIWVRLGHVEPWIWRSAKLVYEYKEPLDIALLQLDNVPEQLSPISVALASPSQGLEAYAIGHGLLGPNCGFSPSVSSGVVSKVVKTKMPPSHKPFLAEGTQHLPAMLQTTAAVHSGASGGAVVNSNGQMIGLITRNAQHVGGAIIPHLNFSIPCAALAPIFSFSEDMKNVSLLQVLAQQDKLSTVWKLVSAPSERPSPAQEENARKKRKVSIP